MSRAALSLLLSLAVAPVAQAAERRAGGDARLEIATAAPIVGGTPTAEGAWPDAVAVLGRQGGSCSGTLIAPDVVLTAGHCLTTDNIDPVSVRLGSTDAMTGGETIDVVTAIPYQDGTTTYDVGVLLLAHPATVAPRVVAAGCSFAAFHAGSQVRVVGFGATTTTGLGGNTRLYEVIVAVTDPLCEDATCHPAVYPGGEFVAGGDNRDSCKGDSGGPVYLTTAHGTVLAGVVSRGTGAQTCGTGGVYVRVDKLLTWIEQRTGAQLARDPCAAAGNQPIDSQDVAGGCATAPGGGGLLLAALIVVARARRRR
jgi:secreted trypsin-like serine protease